MFQCKIVTSFRVLPHHNPKTPNRFLPCLGLWCSWGCSAVTTLETLATLAQVQSQNDIFIKNTKTVDLQAVAVGSLSFGIPTLETLATLAQVQSQNDIFIKNIKTVDLQTIEVDSLSFGTPTLETLATLARVQSQNDVFIKNTKTVDLRDIKVDPLSFETSTLETLATLARVQSQIFTKLTGNLQSLQSQRVDSSAIYFMLSN